MGCTISIGSCTALRQRGRGGELGCVGYAGEICYLLGGRGVFSRMMGTIMPSVLRIGNMSIGERRVVRFIL